jgi:hypothetical protein
MNYIKLWAGNPAKYVRKLNEEELDWIKETAERTCKMAAIHAEEFALRSDAYQEAERLGFEVYYRSKIYNIMMIRSLGWMEGSILVQARLNVLSVILQYMYY